MKKAGKLILRLISLGIVVLGCGILVGLMGDIGLLFTALLAWILYDFVK